MFAAGYKDKGDRDRVTLLSESAAGPLAGQLEVVRALHERDLAAGFGRAVVLLPDGATVHNAFFDRGYKP